MKTCKVTGIEYISHVKLRQNVLLDVTSLLEPESAESTAAITMQTQVSTTQSNDVSKAATRLSCHPEIRHNQREVMQPIM